MRDCCDKEHELVALRQSHEDVLWTVLGINLVMFIAELIVGFVSHSTAVLADGADMLGDSLVYAFSLFVLRRSEIWQARASMLKGMIMVAFGLLVLVQAGMKFTSSALPSAEMMGWMGAIALFMNLICFGLLWRHRSDNLNMESTWVCSRNDLIANSGVLLAAWLTTLTLSKWPDLIVGLLIAAVFLRSAISVVRRANAELGERTIVHQEDCCRSRETGQVEIESK